MTETERKRFAEFAVLPTPIAYQLVTIDDDDGNPIIENRISEPETVIGFLVHRYYGYTQFEVMPVTPSGVYDDSPEYALIRPDGKVETTGMRNNQIFDSIDDWKQFMRYEARESYLESATEFAKSGDRKGAAQMRRCAREHQREIDKNE
jgi:hypothetical protein